MRRCADCHADVPDDARKCARCGEWLDGPLVLTGAAKVALLILVVEIGALVWLRLTWIPAMTEMLRELATALPGVTRVAIAGPTVVGVAALLAVAAVAALLGVRRPRRRETALVVLAGGGFVLLGLLLWALYLPIFDLAGNIET